MAADESLVYLLNLFSYLWFENQILEKNSVPTFVWKVDDDVDNNDEPKLGRISTSTSSHDADDKSSISSSQESLSSGGSDNLLSPNSVLMIRSPKNLQTILSAKESDDLLEAVSMEKHEPKKVSQYSNERLNNTRRRRRGKGKGLSTKSLSELEFEELKGFMDLGFVFSEQDKNSRLAQIIPGLQRFGKQEEQDKSVAAAAAAKQPYLSQAWEDMEHRRKLAAEKLKWKINAAVDNQMDMKHQLKFWAHTVASAIK